MELSEKPIQVIEKLELTSPTGNRSDLTTELLSGVEHA